MVDGLRDSVSDELRPYRFPKDLAQENHDSLRPSPTDGPCNVRIQFADKVLLNTCRQMPGRVNDFLRLPCKKTMYARAFFQLSLKLRLAEVTLNWQHAQ
jgi:hypothetical protein